MTTRKFVAQSCLRVLALLVLLSTPLTAWAAKAVTSTSLTTSSRTVNTRSILVLTAKVNSGSTTITQGLVRFYDGNRLVGTAQIVNTGTKYVHGAAYLAAELAPGAHVLKAVFAGTSAYASSSSATSNISVAGGSSSITLAATGTQGNYTLTGTVIGTSVTAPTGQVIFLDSTNSTAIGTAALGTATETSKFATAAPYGLYASTGDDFPQQVILADLNGDGLLDMAVLDYSAVISVYMGKGDGTFTAAKSYCMITGAGSPQPCDGGDEPTSVAIGDFNSDGIPDLVWASGSYVQVALGNGDGTFQQPVQYDTQGGDTQALVADINMDGTPDLIVSISDGVSILLGNGDGTFQPHCEVGLVDASTYITVGDFNKDGIPDIASAGWNGSTLMVLLGKGDGSFKPEIDTPIDINTAGCTVAAADFKGTGFLSDMAICGEGLAEALAGKGDGTFAAPQTLYPNGSFSEYANWILPVDMNGDGIVDLAFVWDSADTDLGRIGIFTGKGDGTFNTTPTNLITGKQPVFLASGDLNGDGTLDLVTANDTDNNVSVLLDGATSMASAVLSKVSVPGSGTQTVDAQYAGDNDYTGSASNSIQLQAGGTVTLTSLSPASSFAGGAEFALTVYGTGFATGAYVTWNGSARTTAFVSSTQLAAAIQASDVAVPGTNTVEVVVGTASSSPLSFLVVQNPAMVPHISSLSPNSAPVNSSGVTMTVKGMNFSKGMMGSSAYWGSTPLATTIVNATTITALVPAAALSTAGNVQVTVMNPGSTQSNALPFTVTGPVTHMPLAYGFFNKDGSAENTSGNITCAWNANSTEYLCSITGETFFYSKYVVNATVGDVNTVGIIAVNSAGGQAIVKIYNTSGTAIQAPFYLLVFKP